MRLFDRQTEHDASGEVDEVYFQYFRHEGEASRRTQVAFYYLDVVVLGQKLYVERASNIECTGDLRRNLLYAAHCLDIELLRRKLYCGVA